VTIAPFLNSTLTASPPVSDLKSPDVTNRRSLTSGKTTSLFPTSPEVQNLSVGAGGCSVPNDGPNKDCSCRVRVPFPSFPDPCSQTYCCLGEEGSKSEPIQVMRA